MNFYYNRQRNTHSNGSSFSEAMIEAVWQKGTIVPGYDPRHFRKDFCAAWMQRCEYGNTNSQYGWEIDHYIPVSQGGSDNLNNLQPLQWENNRHKSDNWPNWSCLRRSA